MKKLFVILLSLALMLMFVAPVSADNNDNHVYFGDTTDNQIDVIYEVGDEYSITIPAEISFRNSRTVFDWVNATDLQLPLNCQINVYILSTHQSQLALHNENGVPVYFLDYELHTIVGAVETRISLDSNIKQLILTHTIGDTIDSLEKRVQLRFDLQDLTDVNVAAGIYKDKLSFYAERIDPAVNP